MSQNKNKISHKLETLLNSLPEEVRNSDADRVKITLDCLDLDLIPEDLAADLVKVLVCSNFICKWACKHPDDFCNMLAQGVMQQSSSGQDSIKTLQDKSGPVINANALGTLLRQHRQQQMVRIAWRDITQLADLEETLYDLSCLADNCIALAYEKLHGWLCEEYGQPVNANGEAQSMIVIAMGKLGGQELNFSSDVDLIFAYPEEGETQGGRRGSSNAEFFIRLGQQLINVIDQNTSDGIVFRVDMRLRPFGNSGALALSFDALENYYQTHGREWERYAMIKARFLTGESRHKKQLWQILKPFVYRRYLDFNVYDSLRGMKHMIEQEVRRKDIDHNVKLGAGGIREIEFISQTFQLIRGGRQPDLQNPRLLPTLEHLAGSGLLPDFACEELKQAYIFLRNSEHRLQEYDDQQTHNLPKDQAAMARLAYAMGFNDVQAYRNELAYHREHVRNHFDQVFVAPQKDQDSSQEFDLSAVWNETATEAQSGELLKQVGYHDPATSLKTIHALHKSNRFKALGSNARILVNQLMPLLLSATAKRTNADATLPRVIKLIEQIMQRSTYIALLLENPMALSQVVRLFAASPWIAELLARHPILLDELLDPRTLYAPPDKTSLRVELERQLEQVEHDDLESQMEVLRLFKQVNVLRVAAADIVGVLPIMKVSDHLTWIAEVILQQVLDIAWQDLIGRHGSPQCAINGKPTEPGFAIIAYGKLGGIELGYGSDLDLVFLHCSADDTNPTNGDKPIANPVFFARLGQRIIHLVNTHTPSGVLYEVDMRLRPSGASGMLVSHIDTFAEYQANKAWTWEHQALVRARYVTGDRQVAAAFEQVRQQTLAQQRDVQTLKAEVKEMREKMRQGNEKKDKSAKEEKFDLKQGRGGIADIEFMVQYGVLAWSVDHPELLEFSDNIRLLESFENIGCLSGEDAACVMDAYRHYRNLVHRLTLSGEAALVDAASVVNYREQVIRIWDKLLGPV